MAYIAAHLVCSARHNHEDILIPTPLPNGWVHDSVSDLYVHDSGKKTSEHPLFYERRVNPDLNHLKGFSNAFNDVNKWVLEYMRFLFFHFSFCFSDHTIPTFKRFCCLAFRDGQRHSSGGGILGSSLDSGES